jgi:hypothetical protein
VSGIDLSPEMIAAARDLYPELQSEVGPMLNLNSPDGALGGALAWYSTIHAPDDSCRAGRRAGGPGYRGQSSRVFVARSRLGDVRRLPVPAGAPPCRGKRQGVAQASPPPSAAKRIRPTAGRRVRHRELCG